MNCVDEKPALTMNDNNSWILFQIAINEYYFTKIIKLSKCVEHFCILKIILDNS